MSQQNFRQLRCNRIGNAGRIRGAKQGISVSPDRMMVRVSRKRLLRRGELASPSLHDDQAVLASDRKVEACSSARLMMRAVTGLPGAAGGQ